MTENKSSGSRRKLLKSIAAGSGAIVAGKSLPETWHRPVVDSVMLPAHAETSPETITCEDDTSLCAGTYTGVLNGISINNRLLNCASIGSAGASGSIGLPISVVISGDGSVSLLAPAASATLVGNTFILEWQNTIATINESGTTCELWLVLNGTITPGANQIQVQEIWEWRCTGATACTNQYDAGQLILTLV